MGTGALGVATNGDDSESGLLVTETRKPKIPAKGWVKITLNMLEYTYKIEALGNISPFLYVRADTKDGNQRRRLIFILRI